MDKPKNERDRKIIETVNQKGFNEVMVPDEDSLELRSKGDACTVADLKKKNKAIKHLR